MFYQNQAPVDKNSRAALEGKYRYALLDLLSVCGFTLVNLILLFLNSGIYFLYSISLSYRLPVLGMFFDAELQTGTTLTLITSVIAVVVLAAFVLCWIFARKKPVWMVVASVLFGIDTFALIVLGLLFFEPISILLDLIFHVILLVIMIRGAIAGIKASKMPPDEQVFNVNGIVPTGVPADAPAEVPADAPAAEADEAPAAESAAEAESNVWDTLQPEEEKPAGETEESSEQ